MGPVTSRGEGTELRGAPARCRQASSGCRRLRALSAKDKKPEALFCRKPAAPASSTEGKDGRL
jgi:hypothetical protein